MTLSTLLQRRLCALIEHLNESFVVRLSGFATVALLTFSASAQIAPSTFQGANPTFIAISDFGSSGASVAPTALLVNADEEKQIAHLVQSMPPFPRYLYSGCQDRAHAAYLLMTSQIRPKIMKIWVITPSKYTAAIHGSIRSTRSDPEYQAVNWGYHVALAYRTKDGLKIIDPALRPGVVLSQDEWFGEMKESPLTIWTLTDGRVYQFFLSPVDNNALNTQIWDGNTFEYTGTSLIGNWIPSALARDAIGVDAMHNLTCPSLAALATQPDALKTSLENPGTFASTNPCHASMDRFAAEKARWITVLSANP